MTIHVRAPATTANLGPGFDVAGAALDLWNELVVAEPNGALDESHLGVRAFARYATPAEWSFTFTDRIPRERGLGSSAAVIALGLVAGAIAAGVEPTADELLARGIDLEGPCRQSRGRARRRRLPDLGRPRLPASPMTCLRLRSRSCRRRM